MALGNTAVPIKGLLRRASGMRLSVKKSNVAQCLSTIKLTVKTN